MTKDHIHLSTVDAGLGLPLVFLHGFPLCRGVWQKQIDAFRTSYRVIAPDIRGFGNSATHPGPTLMSDCAADLNHLLLNRLTTGPVVLIGHSMGGYVALDFVRQFPEMLLGLVLVSTKAGQDSADAAARRCAMAERVKTEGVQAVIEAMAPKMLSAGNRDAGALDQVRGFMASSKPAGVIGALLGMAERSDSTSLLAQIVAPTLVITGADDTIIPPAESEKMAQGIRGAHLTIIPHAGHIVAFEKPDEFNRALKDWLMHEVLPSTNDNHHSKSDRITHTHLPAEPANRLDYAKG